MGLQPGDGSSFTLKSSWEAPNCWMSTTFINYYYTKCLGMMEKASQGRDLCAFHSFECFLEPMSTTWTPGYWKGRLAHQQTTSPSYRFQLCPTHFPEVLTWWFSKFVFAFPLYPGTRFSICLRAAVGTAVMTRAVLMKPSAGSTCHFMCQSRIWLHEITRAQQLQASQRCPRVMSGGR